MARARPGGVGACEGTESARRARCLKVFKPVDARARRDRRKACGAVWGPTRSADSPRVTTRSICNICGLWSIQKLDKSRPTPHRQRPAARRGTWRLPAAPTTMRLAPPLSVRRQRVPLASLPSPWSGLAVSK